MHVDGSQVVPVTTAPANTLRAAGGESGRSSGGGRGPRPQLRHNRRKIDSSRTVAKLLGNANARSVYNFNGKPIGGLVRSGGAAMSSGGARKGGGNQVGKTPGGGGGGDRAGHGGLVVVLLVRGFLNDLDMSSTVDQKSKETRSTLSILILPTLI